VVASFLGRYEYQLDPKGRVSLPADFRRRADGSRYVLLQWEDTHLTLFPEDVWADVQERILELRRTRRMAANHLRRITSRGVHVEPDKQGRILIPSWLGEAVGLDGTVLVTGNVDRIELWNPETFERMLGAEEPKEGELSEVAHEIFG
jgi:MraZ protein